jgi:AcrR family transcriptional regulator
MSAQLSKEERRRQLLDAALECFGTRGYHQTQVSDIIEKADVARGTFYLYFESKREIFKALMEELFEKVTAQIQALPRDAVEKIPSQLLGNISRVTDLLFAEPLLTRLLFNEAVGLDEEQDAQLRNFYQQILDYIHRGLKQGQEMGFVREGNVQVMALCLLGSLKEIFYQSLLGTEKTKKDEVVQELFRTVAGAVIDPAKLFLVEHFLK